MKTNRIFSIVFCCLLLGVSLYGQSYQFTWDFNTAHDVNFAVHQERGLVNGLPEDIEDHTLTFHFPGDGTVDIDYDSTYIGSFSSVSGQLELSDINKIPPYNGIILLALLPVQGQSAVVGDQWQTVFPSDAQVASEDDKVSLQDRFSTTFAGVRNGNFLNLDLAAHTRALDTSYLRSLLGDAAVNNSPILNWNLFLTGTSIYDAASQSIHHAELYFIIMPDTDYTADGIVGSMHRQYVVISKL